MIVICEENRFVSREFTLVVQATVKQAVFDATGEVFVKDTHTTEAEQNGYRETQMRMDIGSGERPIEDLPMFSNALDKKEAKE